MLTNYKKEIIKVYSDLDDNFGFSIVTHDVNDVALDGQKRHAFRSIHVVPDGHVLTALCHNNIYKSNKNKVVYQ